MNKWLGAILLLAVAYIGATYFLGLELMSLMGVLFVGAVFLIGKGFTKFAGFVPVNQKTAKTGGVLLMAVVLFMGGFLNFLVPGAIGPGDGAPGADTGGMDADSCWSLASDELRGKSASIVQNAYDQQSNSPLTTAVDANPTNVYLNGIYHTALTDTSAATLTTAAVGQVLDYYPAGTTYYGEHTSMCVLTESASIQLDVHSIAADSEMDVTCYDSDGSALSAAGNTSQSDYDITMGASETTTFVCKLKTNVADHAFNFGGVVIGYFEGTADTIDGVELLGVDEIDADQADGYSVESSASFGSKSSPPKFAANSVIAYDTDANTSAGYSDYWELNSPVLLENWESIKIDYSVTSGGSDPTADVDDTPTTKTAFYIYHLDAAWTRGADGKMYESTHTVDSQESNVGLTELLNSPVGSTLGVAIELI